MVYYIKDMKFLIGEMCVRVQRGTTQGKCSVISLEPKVFLQSMLETSDGKARCLLKDLELRI
jgi:hypothetical protein